MTKDTIVNGRMAKKTDMPAISRAIDEETPYRNDGIYPKDEEIANALWLMDLMISKTRLYNTTQEMKTTGCRRRHRESIWVGGTMRIRRRNARCIIGGGSWGDQT